MKVSAFPLRPRYIRCSTTCLSLSLSKKMLDHFGVILLNTSVTLSNAKIAAKAIDKKMLLDLMSRSQWDSNSSYCRPDEPT
jgi:hypothetical protein